MKRWVTWVGATGGEDWNCMNNIIVSLLNWVIEGDYSKWIKFVEWIDLEIKWWKNLNCLKMKDRDEREF